MHSPQLEMHKVHDEGGYMRKVQNQLNQIAKTSESFDELYYEISHDWKRKAEALQIRRWRALNHGQEGGY